MQPYKTHEFSHKGYTITISLHHDEDMREPWKEHDGHGIVSEPRRYCPGTSGRKSPGEWPMYSDESRYVRFYDHRGTMARARKEGWGLSDESEGERWGKPLPSPLEALAVKLGKPKDKLTKGEITAEAVRRDFEHLNDWLRDEWHWCGYTTTITAPDGDETDGDSCWGYESTDESYAISEASDNARAIIDEMILTAEQTEIAACCP